MPVRRCRLEVQVLSACCSCEPGADDPNSCTLFCLASVAATLANLKLTAHFASKTHDTMAVTLKLLIALVVAGVALSQDTTTQSASCPTNPNSSEMVCVVISSLIASVMTSRSAWACVVVRPMRGRERAGSALRLLLLVLCARKQSAAQHHSQAVLRTQKDVRTTKS